MVGVNRQFPIRSLPISQPLIFGQTCTLLTANRPSAVGHLYRFVTREAGEASRIPNGLHIPTAVNKAALMRESALKSVIFVGVPRVSNGIHFSAQGGGRHHLKMFPFQVILSLAALHEALDGEVKQALRTKSHRFVSPVGYIYLFFAAVHQRARTNLNSNVGNLHYSLEPQPPRTSNLR